MKPVKFAQTILAGGVLLPLLAACAKNESRAGSADQPKKDGVRQNEILADLPGEMAGSVQHFRTEVIPLLQNADYENLEKEAAGLRREKTQQASGQWLLRNFYQAVGEPGGKVADSIWEKRLQELRRWTVERPKSITARVALAWFWVSYAWDARGSEWARKVADEGWRLMGQRLQTGAEVLREAESLEEKCPVFFAVQQRIALGQGTSRGEYDHLFSTAIATEPAYTGYYFHKGQFLLKRWFGASDLEWVEFATAEADRVGGKQGDLLYARIACYIFGLGIYDQFLDKSGVSWPRLKKGLEIAVEAYPDSLWAKSQLCYFCGQQGDRERCKQLWPEIGSRVETSVWDRERFLADRTWAFKK